MSVTWRCCRTAGAPFPPLGTESAIRACHQWKRPLAEPIRTGERQDRRDFRELDSGAHRLKLSCGTASMQPVFPHSPAAEPSGFFLARGLEVDVANCACEGASACHPV